MNEETEYPKCHFCGQEIAEGLKVKRRDSNRDLYICYTCVDLISAVAHDAAYGIFDDIVNVMGANKTWKERLETWQYKEVEAK